MAAAKTNVTYIERGEKTSIDWISMRPILDPEIPETELRRYAYSELVVVRRAAAFNPAMPTSVLEDLALDANPTVRAAAEMSLRARSGQVKVARFDCLQSVGRGSSSK